MGRGRLCLTETETGCLSRCSPHAHLSLSRRLELRLATGRPAWVIRCIVALVAAVTMPPKKKAAGGGKKKKSKPSISASATPSPLSVLLSSHHEATPALLASFPARTDLITLQLHLLSFPHLTLSFLLSTSSPLSTLSHRIEQHHGPSSVLSLFSSPTPPLTPLPLSLRLQDVGCTGGSAEEERRYELWYDFVSDVTGSVVMKEPRLPAELEEEGEEQSGADQQRGLQVEEGERAATVGWEEDRDGGGDSRSATADGARGESSSDDSASRQRDATQNKDAAALQAAAEDRQQQHAAEQDDASPVVSLVVTVS